jgi:capsular polysaccharide biosynthesis protein
LLLLVAPVIVAFIAFAVAWYSERVYAGRAEVILDLQGVTWDAAERFIGTELAVANSRAVLGPVSQKFRVSMEELTGNLSVEVLRNSSIVQLEYESANASLALELTKAITEQYVAVMQELAASGDLHFRVLTAPFLLETPVSPQPLRAAVLGAVAGLALAVTGIILWAQLWRTSRWT